MSMTDGPDDHDHDESLPDELRAQFDTLLERFEGFSDDLRKMGLYVEGPGPQMAQIPTPFGMAPAMVVQCQIGRVAFSDRVQNPEADQFERSFAVMEVNAEDDAFLDERERIRKALEAGEDPYAVEDDGERVCIECNETFNLGEGGEDFNAVAGGPLCPKDQA